EGPALVDAALDGTHAREPREGVGARLLLTVEDDGGLEVRAGLVELVHLQQREPGGDEPVTLADDGGVEVVETDEGDRPQRPLGVADGGSGRGDRRGTQRERSLAGAAARLDGEVEGAEPLADRAGGDERPAEHGGRL